VGLKVKEDGTIADISFAGPAAKAGISPATRLIAVNNRQFTSTVLREAVQKAGTLDLLIRNGEYYQTYHVDYRGGERYPHLVRDSSTPDLLTAIISAKAKK
jgi:predicted metalloprotease with PDZ domain